jgi:beta-aspartyl-peptidase (threonine type)
MEYKGLSLKEACDVVVKDKLVKMGGEGGLIAVNAKGEHNFCFNSAGMYRGMRNSEGQQEIAYYK